MRLHISSDLVKLMAAGINFVSISSGYLRAGNVKACAAPCAEVS